MMTFDYVPVKRLSDGVLGLYNKVYNRFSPVIRDIDMSSLLDIPSNVYVPQFADLVMDDYHNYTVRSVLIDKYGFERLGKYESWIIGSMFRVLDSSPAGTKMEDINWSDYPDIYTNSTYKELVLSKIEREYEHGNTWFLFKRPYLKDGEIHYLYLLHADGTATDTEWLSNFRFAANEDGFHEGFAKAAEYVFNEAMPLIDGDKEHRELLITGYSRGAAIASILTEKIEEAGLFDHDSIRTYVAACPNYTVNDKYLDNLFILDNKGDMVPQLPFSSWGFKKSGNVIFLRDEDMPDNYEGVADSEEIKQILFNSFSDPDLFNDDSCVKSILIIMQTALGQYRPTAEELLDCVANLAPKLKRSQLNDLLKIFKSNGLKPFTSHYPEGYREWIKNMDLRMKISLDAAVDLRGLTVSAKCDPYYLGSMDGFVCVYDDDGRFLKMQMVKDSDNSRCSVLKFNGCKDASEIKLFISDRLSYPGSNYLRCYVTK